MKLPKELTTVTTFSKYLALSLFVLLPILAFFLGMRYSQFMYSATMPEVVYTSPPSANESSPAPATPDLDWVKFSSTKAMVEFYYPSLFSVEEESNGDLQEFARFAKNGEQITFERLKNENTTINEKGYSGKRTSKTVNGLSWTEFIPTRDSEYCDAGHCGTPLPSYYLRKNPYLYMFYYTDNSFKEDVEKILSTFKFLANEEVVVPTNWKTYTHKSGGFSFRFPSDWFPDANPAYPGGNNIGFFKVGTTPDHGYGDHPGTEVFHFEYSNDKRTLEEMYPDLSTSKVSEFKTTIDGKQGIIVPGGPVTIKVTKDKVLNIANNDQVLSTLKFTN